MRAISAGTDPDTEVPPNVINGLLRDGIDVRGRRPRHVAAEELASAARVVTFGCDLSGIAPPGVAVQPWDDIPAVSADFGAARDAIVSRMRRLLTEWETLPR